ncbi:MAG TPA: hypothetical protein VFE47_30870 [Tepidisphaeraceae bacterium]|jgi:hypothetical protein|nr:hypothetical protein [Tepidisphaeraceae bacterium]
MREISFEKRLSELERRVSELDRTLSQSARKKDWRRSIGVFTDDPSMQDILKNAMRIRANDRAQAHRRAAKKPVRA